MKKLNSVLFTHDDLDGAGCRIIYSLANFHNDPETWEVYNSSISNLTDLIHSAIADQRFTEDTEIYFADIVPVREVLEDLVKRFNTVRIFDHHRTNVWAEFVCYGAVVKAENKLGILQSGTNLLYEHFSQTVGDGMTKTDKTFFQCGRGNTWLQSLFVDTVRQYDTYEWKENGNILAKQLQVLFFLLGMDRFCKRYVELLATADGSRDLICATDMEFIQAKMESEQKRIDAFTIDNVDILNLRGYKAAFAISTIGMNISELSYQFLHKNPDIDLFIGFSFANGGEFSFRTIRDDLDTGAVIAQPIGGGGHPKASGAQLTKDQSEIMKMILEAALEGAEMKYTHIADTFEGDRFCNIPLPDPKNFP